MRDPKRRSSTRHAILDAAVRLAARGGPSAATMRAIAREVGVTEAALYRHFASKEEILRRAAVRVAEELDADGQPLLDAALSTRQALRAWIKSLYACYDRSPDAFACALLGACAVPVEPDAARSQWDALRGRLGEAIEARQVRPLPLELACSLAWGSVLGAARLIRAGMLRGPASPYVDDVTDSVWRALARTI